jgi:hypothetical protein
MSDKTILTIAYSAISGFGLWLIIDVGGWIAIPVGVSLMFFAGSGLAGMAVFGSAGQAISYGKSSRAGASLPLSSLAFAHGVNNFFVELSDEEINQVYDWGQFVAPSVKYQTAYNMPRVMPKEIGFPYCAVGEFTVLFSILEKRGDTVGKELLESAVIKFEREFHDQIENLELYLGR